MLCMVAPQAQNRRATGKAPTATTQKQKGKSQKQNGKGQKQKAKSPTYTNDDIKNLQKQRADVQKKLKEHEKLLKANKADVKKGMDNLISINSEISEQQKTITGIEQDISHLDGNIDLLKAQLSTLEKQLTQHKERYVKSMRYMARNRNIQDRLMFIFSAKNFAIALVWSSLKPQCAPTTAIPLTFFIHTGENSSWKDSSHAFFMSS